MADAQCRSFAKNKCMPQLEPYKFNETFNAAQLSPGEEAEVNITFYSGQEYRLIVCAHPILGDVNWKLVDAGNRIVFESLADEPEKHLRPEGGKHHAAESARVCAREEGRERHGATSGALRSCGLRSRWSFGRQLRSAQYHFALCFQVGLFGKGDRLPCRITSRAVDGEAHAAHLQSVGIVCLGHQRVRQVTWIEDEIDVEGVVAVTAGGFGLAVWSARDPPNWRPTLRAVPAFPPHLPWRLSGIRLRPVPPLHRLC